MAALEYSQDFTNNSNLVSALYAYPEAASAAAYSASRANEKPSSDWVVTFYDKMYKPIGQAGDYISLEAEFKRNDVGTATIVLKGNDPLVPFVLESTNSVVPVTIQAGANMRWSGRVNSFALALDNKVTTCTVQCVDDYTWFSRMLVWPNFLLPIEIQFPSRAIFVGPAVNCVLTMVAEQAFRLQSGIWELVNNLGSLDLNWESWFGTLLESDGNIKDMLLTPIVVQYIDPIFDTSPWIALTGRMDKISDLIKDVLADYGLTLTASVWLPGDPQPATECMGMSFIPFAVPLSQPCILVTCVDRSGIVGPTGTFIDGLIEQTVNLTDSVLGTSLFPFINGTSEYYPSSLAVNIAPRLGVNFVPSWVTFNGDIDNVGDTGLTNFKLTGYAPVAHTVIGGGKSPQWLDDLINATLEWLIDSIEILVGFTGIPDSLLNGTFDDLLLAFQQQENFGRRVQLGPYGFPEYFQKTGASAYTVDEWFALMQAMFDTQGYNCIELTWQDGYPYTVGRDVFLGSLVSFALNGKLYTDYIYQIKLKDDRKNRRDVEVIVGNGKRNVNPVLRIVKMLTGLEEVINVLSLSSGHGG
jgi:hypothetical protein